MRLGELCAGYGGLGLAVEEVFGATTAWFSEFDDAPSKILAHHWPDVPNYGDMTKIDWAAIEPVDIISGGTPCQDLSGAGKRKGMTEGTRSNLWVQMREAIAIQRPAYVVWENVRGAYSATAASDLEQCPGCMGDTTDGGAVLRALGRVLGDLSDLGFDTEWRGLRAADVGACHGRFRVFVLAAHPSRIRRGEAVQHDGRSTPAVNGPTISDESDSHPMRPRPIGGGTEGATSHPGRYGFGWGQKPNSQPQAHGEESEPRGHANRLDMGAGGLAARRHLASVGEADWGVYTPAIRRWEAALGRRAPSPTEPATRGDGRRLSPRFTEWMMGLPDGWVSDPAIGISRNEQLKACGNGVVPQQAIAALQDMLASFETGTIAA